MDKKLVGKYAGLTGAVAIILTIYYKKLIDYIFQWLDSNIDKDDEWSDYGKCQSDVREVLSIDSADLKEKIELALENEDFSEFGE